jgi:hypothetical protein
MTGCCPNDPREDVASFLRFAQAVRGIFFEVRSLIKIPMTAFQNLIAKLFGQQPDDTYHLYTATTVPKSVEK